ncbi:MAG: L-2-hydroxyglutarate oxidase [Actinomycetota bacterium]|nr:L-2-hydroxyglutarate oxidase [Actinomycetota bacterium]
MRMRADLVVIGGGIVGLAAADAWLHRNPQGSVIVIEKEPQLAAHASGRNSGVLHAGFYYAPDSLKARLTRQGNAQLRDFCAEAGIAVRATGKVVVAQSEDELPALRELHKRAVANGVEVELIDEQQLRALEPLARTHGSALWSPTTAVADPTAVVEALAARVLARGGLLLKGTEVLGAGPGWVRTAKYGEISAGHIINAAGLYADVVAHWFGVGTDYRMLPFKGLYWYGSWEPGRLTRHVYPVPDARNPFLGVHLTVTVHGRAKIGPTAIPALWREDYGGIHGISAAETLDIARTYPRFFTSKDHDVAGLMRSELPKYSRKHLVRQAASLVPSVRVEDFTEKGRVGVRAQLFHLPSKKLEMDFVVEQGEASTHILNAVSPGWTSSLAFAGYVIDAVMG